VAYQVDPASEATLPTLALRLTGEGGGCLGGTRLELALPAPWAAAGAAPFLVLRARYDAAARRAWAVGARVQVGGARGGCGGCGGRSRPSAGHLPPPLPAGHVAQYRRGLGAACGAGLSQVPHHPPPPTPTPPPPTPALPLRSHRPPGGRRRSAAPRPARRAARRQVAPC
jgi:hypothetical protein